MQRPGNGASGLTTLILFTLTAFTILMIAGCGGGGEVCENTYIAYDSQGEPNVYSPLMTSAGPGPVTDIFNSGQVPIGTGMSIPEESCEIYFANEEGSKLAREAVQVVSDYYRYGLLDPVFFEGGEFKSLRSLLKDAALESFEIAPDDHAAPADICNNVVGADVKAAKVNAAILNIDESGNPSDIIVDVYVNIVLKLADGDSHDISQIVQFQVDPNDMKIKKILFEI